MGRNIQHILYFREDLSSFLVHLTRRKGTLSASELLKKILRERCLVAGDEPISDARLFLDDERVKSRFCRAISFTETPLNEIHCLLEIWGRSVELEPFGLVFLKDSLRPKGVAPVFYINNESGDKRTVVEALCRLIDIDARAAEQILPLVSSFGKMLVRPGEVDFTWEREWRYPSSQGNLVFNMDDVFIGICPHDVIDDFEAQFPELKFVDCRRNMKWYATKLVEARHERDLKCSVV